MNHETSKNIQISFLLHVSYFYLVSIANNANEARIIASTWIIANFKVNLRHLVKGSLQMTNVETEMNLLLATST